MLKEFEEELRENRNELETRVELVRAQIEAHVAVRSSSTKGRQWQVFNRLNRIYRPSGIG